MGGDPTRPVGDLKLLDLTRPVRFQNLPDPTRGSGSPSSSDISKCLLSFHPYPSVAVCVPHGEDGESALLPYFCLEIVFSVLVCLFLPYFFGFIWVSAAFHVWATGPSLKSRLAVVLDRLLCRASCITEIPKKMPGLAMPAGGVLYRRSSLAGVGVNCFFVCSYSLFFGFALLSLTLFSPSIV